MFTTDYDDILAQEAALESRWYVDVRDNETGQVIGGYYTRVKPEHL